MMNQICLFLLVSLSALSCFGSGVSRMVNSTGAIAGSVCDPAFGGIGRANVKILGQVTALAYWIGEGETKVCQYKVLAPLLAAEATERQFDTGGSQRSTTQR